MTNLEVIIQNLQNLKQAWEDMYNDVKDGVEPFVPCEDEYGSDLTWQIDCHPVFKWDVPCLNDERGIEYGKPEFDENCKECKSAWLMREYE